MLLDQTLQANLAENKLGELKAFIYSLDNKTGATFTKNVLCLYKKLNVESKKSFISWMSGVRFPFRPHSPERKGEIFFFFF